MSVKRITVVLTVMSMIGIVNANLLTNGDFQTGDATDWDNWNSTTTDQDNSGNPLTGNGRSTAGGSGDFAAKAWGMGCSGVTAVLPRRLQRLKGHSMQSQPTPCM